MSEPGAGRRLAAVRLVAVCLGLTIGCVVERHPDRVGTAPLPGLRDDYVYYPNYEVYYGRNHRQYVYRDGNAWVSRPAPAGVRVDVLLTSPSVRVNFHDPPARHHAAVARTYPKNWVRPGPRSGMPDGPGADLRREHRPDGRVSPHGRPWPSEADFGVEE